MHVCIHTYILHTTYKQAFVYVLHTTEFARNSKYSFILVFIHSYIHNPYKEDFILYVGGPTLDGERPAGAYLPRRLDVVNITWRNHCLEQVAAEHGTGQTMHYK